MILAKTAAGQQVLKDRSVALSPQQRAAFILVDGKRSVDDILKATSAYGVTVDDVAHLRSVKLVEPAWAAEQMKPPPADRAGPQARYAAAYPIAAKLTAALGLRGFRLNLAVEGATCYADLVALAPKIREAVGSDNFRPLQSALLE
jgi:hypothetical protein